MTKAVARYEKYSDANKTIRVAYAPGVPTAEANYNGDLRFGSDRAYMTERTAMHEISHTLGVGQTAAFNTKCAAGDWKTALPLLRSFDGANAKITCGGGHFWPYGKFPFYKMHHCYYVNGTLIGRHDVTLEDF
ncbi:unnamed protein product [Alternaria alternata]